jgi:NADPH:quinone reductase
VDRTACVVLWGSILPPFWHRRRIHGGPFGAGGPAARNRAGGPGCLSWYSRHNSSRAVDVAGPVKGNTVLVQGGAGAVGACAVQLAHRAGARVIATCRSESDKEIASRAGADEVLLTDEKLVERIRGLAPDGVNHIVEVAFAANIKTDVEVLAQGGSIATYATNAPTPEIPFWQLVFINARIFFIGSDDIPTEAKIEAARAINQALEAGWQGLEIAERFPLDEIAQAHEFVEHPTKSGRVIVTI